MLKHLVAIAIMSGTALAQPGAEESASVVPNLDALIAQAEAQLPTIESVAAGTVRRARRAISVGPTVGVWSGAILGPGDLDAALTFGVGIETFKVPVMPSTQTIRQLIADRVKAQLEARIKDVFRGRALEPLELNTLVAQVYTDVRDEILGLRNARAKTMERPSLTIGLEANRMFGSERWLGRLRAGVGVWKVTLGLSSAVGRVCEGATCDDGVKVFVGPEVVLHLLTSKDPRASVVDVFARADFQTNSRGVETYDQLVLGVRYLLDVL